jgi:indolepyruvate ferredoxin oxidoreductase alpha subunit
MHSGMTGLLDVVYNQGTTTVCILDNHITAMTGHQDNPATGKTLKGVPAPAVNLEKLVESIGVKHVRVVDPNKLPELEKALLEETAREEPSVIIVRHPCVLAAKLQSTPFRVEEDKCKKCGACFKLGCPAIERPGTARINNILCTGCGVCQQVCKFGAIKAEEA